MKGRVQPLSACCVKLLVMNQKDTRTLSIAKIPLMKQTAENKIRLKSADLYDVTSRLEEKSAATKQFVVALEQRFADVHSDHSVAELTQHRCMTASEPWSSNTHSSRLTSYILHSVMFMFLLRLIN